MASRIFLSSVFIFLASASLLRAQDGSSAIDIYSGGKRYASFDAYHQSEALVDSKSESSSGQAALFENLPIKVDASKVKTVTINPDGARKEQIGPDGLKEDALAQLKPSSEPGPKTVLKKDGKPLSAQVDILDLSRVAGIEPAFQDILGGVDQEPVPVKKVSSSEDIRRDLVARLGQEDPTILIVSDHKKARVMELTQDPQLKGVQQHGDSSPEKP